MEEKSHVSLERHQCPVCGELHERDCGILLDKRLKKSMGRYTVTGWGLCPRHYEYFEKGYITVIFVDESKSFVSGNTLKVEAAYRTGDVMFIRKETLQRIVPEPIFNSVLRKEGVAFMTSDCMEEFKKLEGAQIANTKDEEDAFFQKGKADGK